MENKIKNVKSKKAEKDKRAEISSQQLVLIIILIASFAVILFFIFRLKPWETTNEEICHNSVVLKSTSQGFAGNLDCKTQYLCISGGGDCEGISADTTVDINLGDSRDKEKIMEAIADKMADCWWMFGEGELDYLGIRDKGVTGETSCALCSIIKFDEKILEKDYKITYREFYNYLNSIEKDESETYFTYLYDSFDVDTFQDEVSYLKIDIDDNYILDDEKYAIVTGVKSGALWGAAKKDVFIYPYYVKSSEINSQLKCDGFLTKA